MITLRRLLPLAVFLLLISAATTAPQRAAAIAPLSFSWGCLPADGICDFVVTSNNHAMYRWNFGDGTITPATTSKSASHDYNFTGAGQFYTVYLIGYATNPPSSPDNIIGCTVEAQGPGPGGNPGANGNCS